MGADEFSGWACARSNNIHAKIDKKLQVFRECNFGGILIECWEGLGRSKIWISQISKKNDAKIAMYFGWLKNRILRLQNGFEARVGRSVQVQGKEPRMGGRPLGRNLQA